MHLQAGAAHLKAPRSKAPDLLPSGLEENAIRRAEDPKEKAEALEPAIRIEELSVFITPRKRAIRSANFGKRNGEATMKR